MTRRMTVVTMALLATLAGCGSEDSGPDAEPTATAAPSPTADSPTPDATVDPTPDPSADLVGTWRDDAADWTVRFGADGRFVVDYQGFADFLRGSWTTDGTTVTLTGDDGNTQVGRITAAGLEFDLGTLTKR